MSCLAFSQQERPGSRSKSLSDWPQKSGRRPRHCAHWIGRPITAYSDFGIPPRVYTSSRSNSRSKWCIATCSLIGKSTKKSLQAECSISNLLIMSQQQLCCNTFKTASSPAGEFAKKRRRPTWKNTRSLLGSFSEWPLIKNVPTQSHLLLKIAGWPPSSLINNIT